MASPNFFEISKLAHRRFSALPAYDSAIQLVPLDDVGGKRPAAGFLPSLHCVTKNVDGLALAAAIFPSANLGIRGRREIGAIFVIDVDEPGTLERIECEYGPLPVTYTTLTRPISQPHKRHIYFLQTERLISTFRRQVTDVTRQCGYDLKCAGGWGYVVAEGSVRDGETITALYDHDVLIVPIPDSLVHWLQADVAKGRIQKRLQAKKKPKCEPEPTASHPFAVPRFKRTLAIKSRIRTLKNLGFSDDAILLKLVTDIRQCFEDGDQRLNPGYMRKLRAMIREVPTIDVHTSYSNLLRDRKSKSSPLATIRQLFKTCPDTITSSDAHKLFSVRDNADELRMIRQFRKHGFVLLGEQGSHGRVWSRVVSSLTSFANSISPPSPHKLSSPHKAVKKEHGHATTTTSSESESEALKVKQVVGGQEVGESVITFTFQKDGTPRKSPQSIKVRANPEKEQDEKIRQRAHVNNGGAA